VIDNLPPDSWVALTPDRKLVTGVGSTAAEAAHNAKVDYGLQNPIVIKVKATKQKSRAVKLVAIHGVIMSNEFICFGCMATT
jgi:hypothetical protein